MYEHLKIIKNYDNIKVKTFMKLFIWKYAKMVSIILFFASTCTKQKAKTKELEMCLIVLKFKKPHVAFGIQCYKI